MSRVEVYRTGEHLSAVSRIVAALSASVPFVAPEVIERRRGQAFGLRLGANESMFGPSPRAVAAAAQALRHASWYGDPESWELRERLSERHDTSSDRILVGSGIDDLLGLAVRCILDPGDFVVASAGTYPTFAYHVRAQGGMVVDVPYRDDMHVDPVALARRASEVGARIVYVANPDNPSGTLCPREALYRLARDLPRDCVLFMDEAYVDFVEDPPVAADDADEGRVIRFRTFSKAHGIAGLRIGYVIANEMYTNAFNKVRVQFGVNRVAQAAALASLEDDSHVEWVIKETTAERARFRELGKQLGWTPIRSSTNFIAFDVGSADLATAWVTALERLDVFVRQGRQGPLSRCVRITVGLAEEREQLERILEKVTGEMAPLAHARERVANRG